MKSEAYYLKRGCWPGPTHHELQAVEDIHDFNMSILFGVPIDFEYREHFAEFQGQIAILDEAAERMM